MSDGVANVAVDHSRHSEPLQTGRVGDVFDLACPVKQPVLSHMGALGPKTEGALNEVADIRYSNTASCAVDHIKLSWPRSASVGDEMAMEGEAMSLVTLSLAADRARRPSKWKKLLAEIRQRARSRDELTTLDDHALSDVGLTRSDASNEASKPFWQS